MRIVCFLHVHPFQKEKFSVDHFVIKFSRSSLRSHLRQASTPSTLYCRIHLHSPPFSLYRHIETPYFERQHSIVFTNCDVLFDIIMLPALKRVNLSLTCKYHSPGSHSWKSTATHRSCCKWYPTACFGTSRLYLMHVSQFTQTILNISSVLLSVVPALFSNWASLSYIAYANCLLWNH